MLGLDVDLRFVVTAIQCAHGVIKPAQKWLAKRAVGASLKKKMAVALARQLAIDVWHWRTGRATAAELGWTLNAPGAETATK